MIVEEGIVEVDFVVDQMIDSKIVVSGNASYATNSIVDQRIIQKRSEMT
jgi:hypothetical protein